MTLIVGIVNKDGIVVASDGAATLGNLGIHTARQHAKKLSILQDRIIMGVSGPVGLGQLLTDTMDTIYSESLLRGKNPSEAMAIMSEKFREHIFKEIEAAQKAQVVSGIGPMAGGSAISFSLVALPVSGEPCLFQFNQQGAPEQATEELPFVAIGSGQQIADPFLAFIRRVVWKEQSPNLNEAIFAAIWTVHHAIETNTGGIDKPIQAMILKKIDSDWTAQELTNEEINEHFESVNGMEEYISDFLSADNDTPSIPKPPKKTKKKRKASPKK